MASIYDMIANPTQGKLGDIGTSLLQIKQAQLDEQQRQKENVLANLEQMLPVANATNMYTSSVLSTWNTDVDESLKSDPNAWHAHKMEIWKTLPKGIQGVVPNPEKDNLTIDQFKGTQQRSQEIIKMFGQDEKAKSPFAKINPSQYTPESVKTFEQTGVYGDLVPREKTKMVASPEDYYWRKRFEGQATTIQEVEKSANASVSKLKALDRFIENNEKTPQGSVQPLVTGMQNFLASFGVQFEGLTSAREMEQALGEIQAAYMKELGARGLTDKDMEVLRQSLPRIATDNTARISVARILQKSYATTIDNYSSMRSQEEKISPIKARKIFSPAWNDWYEENRERYLGIESVPEPEEEIDFGEMSQEQLIEYFSNQNIGRMRVDERP